MSTFIKKEGEILGPIGVALKEGKVYIFPCPEDTDPYIVLNCVKKFNDLIGTEVSGMACEAFMQDYINIDDYEHGKMNDDNAKSIIILVLQERHSKERYVTMGIMDKSDNSITEWTETAGATLGGAMNEVDLY